MYVERCEHCECKLIPHGRRASGRSSKIVHYGSLTACGIIQATKGAIRLRIAERDEARQRAADFERDIACLEERAKALAAGGASGWAMRRLALRLGRTYNYTRRRDEGLIPLAKTRRPRPSNGVPAHPFLDGPRGRQKDEEMTETITQPFAVDRRGVLFYVLGTGRRPPVGMTWVTV